MIKIYRTDRKREAKTVKCPSCGSMEKVPAHGHKNICQCSKCLAFFSYKDSDIKTTVRVSTHKSHMLYENRAAIAFAASVVIIAMIMAGSIKHINNRKEETVDMPQITVDQPQVKTVDVINRDVTDEYQTDLPVYDDVWITELEPLKKGDVVIRDNNTVMTNTGEELSHYIYARNTYNEVVYHLGGVYDRLTAVWSVDHDDRNTKSTNDLEIYCDGDLIYRSPALTGGDLPVDIDLDIRECNVLTVMFTDGNGDALLGDIRLYADKDSTGTLPAPLDLPCWLTDLDYLSKSGVRIDRNETGRTNTNEAYNHSLNGTNGEEITYFLNGKYESIRGIWTLDQSDRNTSNNCQFAMYADDVLIYTSPVITAGSLPVDLEVDLNGCVMLRIVFIEGDGDGHIGNVRLFPKANADGVYEPVISGVQTGTWLTDIDYLNKSGVRIYKNEIHTTNTGEDFTHILRGNTGEEITYYLNGKYTRLSGIWTIEQDDRNTTENSLFEVYADDQLIYTSPYLTQKKLPETFDIDIGGCQKMTIRFYSEDASAEMGNVMIY